MAKPSLQDRLKAVKDTAPSLVPHSAESEEPLPHDKKEAEILPDIQEVIDNPQTVARLIQLVNADVAFSIEEKKAKAARKPFTNAIKALLGGWDRRFMCDGHRVVNFNAPRKKLNAKKLLAAGVSSAIINACTDIVPCWTLKITPAGDTDEGEEYGTDGE